VFLASLVVLILKVQEIFGLCQLTELLVDGFNIFLALLLEVFQKEVLVAD
jgi:hypothetical protein